MYPKRDHARRPNGMPNFGRLISSPLSWQEDYPHENGNYVNVCVYCQRYFMGYKRRCVCKECSTPKTVSLMLIAFLIWCGGTAIFVLSGLFYGFGDGIVWAYAFFCSIFIAGAAGQLIKKRRLEQEREHGVPPDENYHNDF